MADMGMGYAGIGAGSSSYSPGNDLHAAAEADPGVVVKTPAAKGKRGKTRGVRNYGATKAKYCGCC
jgi:hypothetical protein